ncbi:MAG: YihY/virulence factor BrkB family protein, partial [Muribaculaceae bacterium]|nr:YihY/virulence factor BrkB family protein [Muribaculaceae bacterium]
RIFMSTTLQDAVPFSFMSPAISTILDCATIVLTWLFFTGVYMLIPNTTVKFRNALLSGILAGVAFQVLQWLFVTGQLYVSKYNAIYGGFAFLPLLLIWMQLVWVICLSGAVLCYSSQNIFRFSFTSEVSDISVLYRRKITLAIMAVVASRFKTGLPPLRGADLVAEYNIPTRLVEETVAELADAGLLSRVVTGNNENDFALQPAIDITGLTLGRVIEAIEHQGASDFIPGFAVRFVMVDNIADNITGAMISRGDNTPIADLDIDGYLQPSSTLPITNLK